MELKPKTKVVPTCVCDDCNKEKPLVVKAISCKICNREHEESEEKEDDTNSVSTIIVNIFSKRRVHNG